MNRREGKPMDEKSLKEWQQAFKDIDESIELVEKESGRERSRKTNRKTTKRKLVLLVLLRRVRHKTSRM